MEKVVAVGHGGAHEIGNVGACVLHDLAVSLDEEVFFGLAALWTISLGLSGFQ